MPFCDDGVTGRRDGTLADAVKLLRAAQMTPEIDTPGYPIIEVNDKAIDSRHLDLQLAMYENTDLAVGAAQIHLNGVIDSSAMAEMVLGGPDVLEKDPAVFGTINANSPLMFDTRMLESLWMLAERNQIVNITPFIMMGAMGPVSVPAALAQQTAEAAHDVGLRGDEVGLFGGIGGEVEEFYAAVLEVLDEFVVPAGGRVAREQRPRGPPPLIGIVRVVPDEIAGGKRARS
jgi:trimethylamine--corrinoid protein Co-methyltransferase